jgi:hypothetical protein
LFKLFHVLFAIHVNADENWTGKTKGFPQHGSDLIGMIDPEASFRIVESETGMNAVGPGMIAP